jgi:Na+-transporting methylmalonyl-CoA/oxaloacetate decarboxylase gamma subunit
LVLPVYGTAENLADRLLILYVFGAVNTLFGKNIFNGSWVKPFEEYYTKTLFGHTVNLVALFTVLYAILAVIGIIVLILVISFKKNKRASWKIATFYEIICAIVLYAYAMFAGIGGGTTWTNYGIIIATLGLLFAMELQAIIKCEGLGAYKVFRFILTVIATVALFDLTGFLTVLSDPLTSFSSVIHSSVAFINNKLGFEYFAVYILNINEISTLLNSYSAIEKFTEVMAIATVLIVLFNLLVDTIGLGRGRKYDRKGNIKMNYASRCFGFVRYFLQLVFAVITLIFVFVSKQTVGLYLYLLILITLIQFIGALERIRVAGKRAKEEVVQVVPQPKESYTSEYVPVETYQPVQSAEEKPEYVQPETPKPTPKPAPAPEPEERDEKIITRTESKPTYKGETDSFIETLDDNEKYEFKRIFLDKKNGELPICDYQVGGENKKFFEDFFIYLGTVKKLATSGLIHKAYLYSIK